MNGKAKPEAASFLLFLDVSFPVKLCGVRFPGFFDTGISEELSGYSSAGKDVNRKYIYHQQGAYHLTLRCCIPDVLFSFSWLPWTAL